MSRYIVHTFFIAGVFYATPFIPYVQDHFSVLDFKTALLAAVIFGLINSIVRPVLYAVTLPFTILTFGLFGFVVNIICFYMVTFVVPGLAVPTLIGAILASTTLAIANIMVDRAIHHD